MEGGINEKLLEVDGLGEADSSLKKKIWSEMKSLWVVAGPAILIPFSTFGIHVISQAFIGQFNATELAAYALIFTVIFRVVLGVQLGMVNGVGTLCGQAFGAKQYHKLGIYLQQSCIILLFVSALLTPLFVFASPVLKALGQDHKIADMAGNFALWFIAVTFLYGVLYSCNAFLQSQSKNLVLFLSWLLGVKLKFGINGVMVSTVLAYLVPNVGQIIYIVCGGCPETWKGFTFLAFEDLGLTTKLSVASGVMICLEFCYNTILILLTGNMGNAEVKIDALSICLNISGWALMVSFGFMAGASVRVSNELGRRDAKAAKFAILMTVLTSFSIGFVLFVFFLVFKENAAYFFTNSKEVAEAVARLSPLLAISLLLNSVQPVLSGVANMDLGSYYLIGLPLGVLLGYVFNLQVEGVWIGIITGTAVQTAILIFMTCTTDWEKQIVLAQKRVNRISVEDETTHHSST